ncbi:hypothetical protein BDZ90DRAFT_276573 [Jaminaea rosea]|uniref:Nucleolar 27S pre-rRNA processing Urb2/Npa2 C-terminal domain-containing protein n=1 Tax=Jaminaea rosea TaxID=1569628 RepID=A0A316UZ62_9BASI|nr:hypothetical protein BDZ90DRAFT_276573 [Jaminaea rosea]PWN30078.1 hypothetical protein BDZ90DRAFT_276573 [Jaminaea rosea]
MAGASLASLGITTSEAFIRKLKGAADPVQCGGAEVGQATCSHTALPKIDLAALAWRERHQGLQIPRLAPLLVEWVLDTLSNSAKQASKAKQDISSKSPLGQPAYWHLLTELLHEPALKGASYTALSPRLTPQSLLLISSCLLKLDFTCTQACLPTASTSIAPLLGQVAAHLSSSSRSSIDEFFTTACKKTSDLSKKHAEAAAGIAALLQALHAPFNEAALENSALSVKSLQALDIDELAKASTRMSALSESDELFDVLQQTIWQWADSTLFNVHALRSQLLPASASSSSPNCVRSIAHLGSEVAVSILPRLIRSAYRSAKLHSSDLANSLRNHARKAANAEATEGDEAIAPEVAAMSLYEAFQDAMLAPALALTSSPDASAKVIAVRSELLDITVQTGLAAHLSRTPVWSAMLRKTMGAVRSTLEAGGITQLKDEHSLTSLKLLWKLDQDLIREQLSAIILCVLRKPISPDVRSSVQSLFNDLFDGFARVQELPELLRLIQRSIAQCDAVVFDNEAALDSTWFNKAIGRAVRVQLPPTQIVEVLQDLATSLEMACDSSSEDEASTPSMKRGHEGDPVAPFARQTNLLKTAHPIVASLPVPAALIEAASPSLERIVSVLRRCIKSALGSVDSGKTKRTKFAKSNKAAGGQSREAFQVVASALWSYCGLCAGQKASSSEQSTNDATTSRDHFNILDDLWLELFTALANHEDSTVRLEMARMLLFKSEQALERGVEDPFYLTSASVLPFWRSTVQGLCDDAAAQTSSQAPLWDMLARRWILVLEHACDEASLERLAGLLISTLKPSHVHYRTSSLAIVSSAEFWEMKRWRKAAVAAIQGDEKALPALMHLPVQYLPSSVREGLLLSALQVKDRGDTTEQDEIAIKQWLCSLLSREGGLSEKAQQALAQRLTSFATSKKASASESLLLVSTRLFQLALKHLILSRHMTGSLLQSIVTSVSAKDPQSLGRLVETLIETSSTQAVKEIQVPDLCDLSRAQMAVQALETAEPLGSISELASLFDQCRLALTLAAVQEKDLEARKELGGVCVANICSSSLVAKLSKPLAHASEEAAQAFLSAFAALLASCAEQQLVAPVSIGARSVLTWASLLATRPPLISLAALPKDVESPFSHFLARLTPEAYEGALHALNKALDHVGGGGEDAQLNLCALLYTLGLTLRTAPPKTLSVAQRYFTAALARVQTATLTAARTAVENPWSSSETLLSCLRMLEAVATGRALAFRPVDVNLVLSLLSSLMAGQGSSITRSPRRQHSSISRLEIAKSIFSSIISILSSLVRLRRELLVPLLPQLGIVLAQIAPLFRRSLPQASSRQKKNLVEGMPRWLTVAVEGDDDARARPAMSDSAANIPFVLALGANEARDFSRLLETISAKSTSTSSGPFGGSLPLRNGGKAKAAASIDSLSRPFSKHAAYVILSYVHAILQPGCYIDAAVKRELLGDTAGTTNSSRRRGGGVGAIVESGSAGGRGGGLTNLCGILGGGTAERDWILANDDLLSSGHMGPGGSSGSAEAGKAVFKDIWARYEAARYRGD